MIIDFSRLSSGNGRTFRSNDSFGSASDEAPKAGNIINFPGSQDQAGFEFQPPGVGDEAVAPFQPKRSASDRSKSQFKLTIFRPSRYETAASEVPGKIIDAGISQVPIDYFPEAV